MFSEQQTIFWFGLFSLWFDMNWNMMVVGRTNDRQWMRLIIVAREADSRSMQHVCSSREVSISSIPHSSASLNKWQNKHDCMWLQDLSNQGASGITPVLDLRQQHDWLTLISSSMCHCVKVCAKDALSQKCTSAGYFPILKMCNEIAVRVIILAHIACRATIAWQVHM